MDLDVFVLQSNIARYHKLLDSEIDPVERQLINELLRLEMARLSEDVRNRVNAVRKSLAGRTIPDNRSTTREDKEVLSGDVPCELMSERPLKV